MSLFLPWNKKNKNLKFVSNNDFLIIVSLYLRIQTPRLTILNLSIVPLPSQICEIKRCNQLLLFCGGNALPSCGVSLTHRETWFYSMNHLTCSFCADADPSFAWIKYDGVDSYHEFSSKTIAALHVDSTKKPSLRNWSEQREMHAWGITIHFNMASKWSFTLFLTAHLNMIFVMNSFYLW